MRMKKIVVRVLPLSMAAIFLSENFLFAQQTTQPNNTITLTTYYPAPFGAYKKMTISDNVGIGTTNLFDKLIIFGDFSNAALPDTDADVNYGITLSNYKNGYQDNQYFGLTFATGNGSDPHAYDFAGIYGVSRGTFVTAYGDVVIAAKPNGNRGVAMNPIATFQYTGNVGIGTTSPVGSLHVRGDGTHPSAIFELGYVGIGPQSPLSTLHIVPTGTGTLFEDGLRIQRDGTPSQYAIINQRGGALNLVSVNTLGTGAYTYFQRSDDGVTYTPSMVIANNCNVGIGTTNPGANLQVGNSGDTGYGAKIYGRIEGQTEATQVPQFRSFSAANTSEWGFGNQDSDSFAFWRLPGGGAWSELMRVTSAGNVGIGTAGPNSKLQVTTGDVYVETQGNGIILKDTNGTGCHRLTVNSAGTMSAAAVTCP